MGSRYHSTHHFLANNLIATVFSLQVPILSLPSNLVSPNRGCHPSQWGLTR